MLPAKPTCNPPIPSCEFVEGCEEEEGGVEVSLVEPCISISAFAVGNQNFNTMRVRGLVNGKPLHILIRLEKYQLPLHILIRLGKY